MSRASSYEVQIIWDVDISQLPYVRESNQLASDRTRPVPWNGLGRRVGYSVLSQDAPYHSGNGFLRRVFWVTDDDPYLEYPWVPVEAVVPNTIDINRLSQRLSPTEFEWDVMSQSRCQAGFPTALGRTIDESLATVS